MKSVVNFAFAGDHSPIPSSQLLENRNAESAPENVAMMIRKRRIVAPCQNDNGGIQARQAEMAASLLLGQRQRESERQSDCCRRPGAQQWNFFGSEFAHVGARAQAGIDKRRAGRDRERKPEPVFDRDPFSKQKRKSHLPR